MSYDNYALAVQDAIAGRGIALGWRYLIDDLIERKLLVAVGPPVHQENSGYYLISPMESQHDAVPRLRDRLVQLIGEP